MKLRITGFEEVVLVPVVELDVVEVLEPLDAVEELEDVDELDEAVLAADELFEPVFPVCEVDDEPAFFDFLALDFELFVAPPLVPLVPDEASWALEPPVAALPPWPVVLPVAPRPVPVVAPVPPTSPIRASTWQRTVALLALSVAPFSTTTISTSPESISTSRNGTCAVPMKFAER